MQDWQKQHKEVMNDFLRFLNERSGDYVLKGGTSLISCYNSKRFSEDIDLDSVNKRSIRNIVEDFCKQNSYTFRVAKDTDTVKRFMIDYGNASKPLKIEISYRLRSIAPEKIRKINDITVYDINTIAYMKSNAYNSRDKLRDLYDMTFVCKNYENELTPQTIDLIRDCLQYKGLEQFDYLVKEQDDEFIDKDQLAEDFLDMFEQLGLVYDEPSVDEIEWNDEDLEIEKDGIDFER